MTEYVIVLNKDEDTVSFIEEASKKVVKTVEVEKNPHEVAATRNGRKAFVSNAGANSISVFDMTTLDIIDTIRHSEFQFPHEGKITADGTLILASTYAHKVFFIDTITHQVTDILPAERMSHMVALSPDDKFAYISNIGSNSYSILEIATRSFSAHIPVGRKPEGINISPDGRWIYVANQDDNNVYCIEAATNSLRGRVATSDVPIRVMFTHDSKYAFVPNRLGNCVSVIDTERILEIKRIPVGLWAGGIDFNAAGTLAYVANNKTNDVSVIDVPSLKVIETIDVGLHPDGLICTVVD